MKSNLHGCFLCLALLGAAACGSSPGRDLASDPGRDAPVPMDTVDEAGATDDLGVPSDADATVPPDLPDEQPDVAFDSLPPDGESDGVVADDAPAADLPPEPVPDLPALDDGVSGEILDLPPDLPPDLLPDVDAGDGAAESGDPCEGPECVPCEDDGLECTDSVREDSGGCVQILRPDFCLIEGACVPTDSKDPDDPCRTCQPGTDAAAYVVAIGLPCEDGVACSLGGVCQADGTCVPAVKPCDDGNPCTGDRCLPGSNTCEHKPVPSDCDDGNLCTYLDDCVAGVCKGTPKTCVDDHEVCTSEGCDPATGTCVTTFNDGPCDDLDWCTTGDTCVAGTCSGGVAVDCSDGNPCTNDYCIQLAGGTGKCESRPFQGACEDGDKCTQGELCGLDGVCKGGLPRSCNDSNGCTDDSCDPATGCVATPNTLPCDDGNPCTVNDACSEGGCHGAPRPCDDGNPCTSDACQNGYCLNLAMPNNTLCDDRNLCTAGDRCVAGRCDGATVVSCDDGNACTLDSCLPGSGCEHAPMVCSDNNPCTTDSCDPGAGCTYVPNVNACDDSDPCTVNDQCGGGTCRGVAMDCRDGDPCTTDQCQEGACQNPRMADNTGCDDSNACTTGEKCYGGSCQGGREVQCADAEDCTADSCNPQVGCVFAPIILPGGCDDRTVCTVSDQCVNGVCAGTPISCDDGNYCTDDLCDPVSGCYHEDNDLLCSDGNACTLLDQCHLGTCAGVNVFANPLSKGATLTLTRYGTPGFGLDVDGSPDSCAPSPDCTDGIDNYFGRLGIFLDDQMKPDLERAVADGGLALLLEHEFPGPGAGPYNLNVMFGRRTDPTSCNPATPGCNYLAFGGDLIGQCSPRYVLPNATIVGDKLTAGGKEFQAVIYFAFGGAMVPQVLKWARVEATVTFDGTGKVNGGSGILAGAIDVKAFKVSLESVPDGQFSPYSKEQIIQQADSRLCSGTECGDMDTDGRSGKDAASIGLPFTIVVGNGVGRL